MAQTLTAAVGIEPRGKSDNSKFDTEIIGLEFNVLGKKMDLQINVGKGESRLANIVPLARLICSKIIDVVLKSIPGDEGRIACHKGCSACCNRYLVPLSVPEAFRLNEEIAEAPAYQRESIWKNCLIASRAILSQNPPEEFVHNIKEASSNNRADMNLISNWYKSFKLACPFLHKNVCTIYDKRPLVCREHYIKGSAKVCSGGHAIAEIVEMPVQIPNALSQLASELEDTSMEAVILPLVLVWCKENKNRAIRTWPNSIMVKRFLEIIKEMANKNCTASVG